MHIGGLPNIFNQIGESRAQKGWEPQDYAIMFFLIQTFFCSIEFSYNNNDSDIFFGTPNNWNYGGTPQNDDGGYDSSYNA